MKGQREKADGKVIELFNCPDCRTEFELKEGQQVADMAQNYFIANMLEVLAIPSVNQTKSIITVASASHQLSVGV